MERKSGLKVIKLVFGAAMICATLFYGPAIAAGLAKFYGTVLELPPDQSWPSGRPYLAMGVHPTSTEAAKANACLPLESSTAGWVEACLSAKTTLKCGNGGYFAVADALSHVTPLVYSQHGWVEKSSGYLMALGVACGQASDQAARKKALAECDAASKKKAIPEPAIGTRDNDPQFHNCMVSHSAFNDGTFQGGVIDFQKVKADAVNTGGFLTSVNRSCWGKASAEFASSCPK